MNSLKLSFFLRSESLTSTIGDSGVTAAIGVESVSETLGFQVSEILNSLVMAAFINIYPVY
jgi:hypothetical protein